MSENNDYYIPPEASLNDPKPADRLPESGPKGLGGWLILPIIGLITTVLWAIWNLADVLSTNFGYLYGYLRLNPLGMLNTMYSIFLLLSSLYLLFLVVKKSVSFPKSMIYWQLFTCLVEIVLIVISVVFDRLVFGRSSLVDAVTYMSRYELMELTILTTSTIVWVTYFRKSIRVKNTFIN